MRFYQQKYIPIFLVILCLVLLLGLQRYTAQVNTVLSDITINTMREISLHDSAFVENTLDRSCSSLSRVGMRLRSGHYTTLQQLQTQLNLEHDSAAFHYIYLIDSEGKMYSGTFLIQDGRAYPHIKSILHGIPRTILRFDDYANQVDYQEETIVYALTLPPFEVQGIRFVGIVGHTSLLDIREHMNRTSFGGHGTSMVIDSAGYYVVNKSDKNGIGQHDNLLESLQDALFLNGSSLSAVQNHLQNGQELLCTYIKEGEPYVLSLTPLKSTDWFLAMSLPATVFTDQSRQFIWLTSGSLLGAFMFCLFLLFCLFLTWKKSISAKANAAARYDFLNRMSHEIRTPLNAIIGLNHLMRHSLDAPKKLEEYLDKSASTSEYLLSLINDVLDISKLEQKAVVMSREPVSLPEIGRSLQTILRERLREKNIFFQLNSRLPFPFIQGDALRLKQVLLNILSNAAKFTPTNGQITMTMTQEPLGNNTRILTRITITDNGIGMSAEFQKHIFESFTQEKKHANKQLPETSTRGTGLGMAISYLLMQQMGGELSVVSTLGKGSCFTVLLPADAANNPQDTETASSATPMPVPMRLSPDRPPHILIAEDNELNAEIITAILQKENCSVVLAQNGQIAVNRFNQSAFFTFDIILMDAQMPLMDGYTAAQIIRRLPRPDAAVIPIYATTANTAPEDRERAQQAGMTGFIAKPLDFKQLLKIIQETMQSSRREVSP